MVVGADSRQAELPRCADYLAEAAYVARDGPGRNLRQMDAEIRAASVPQGHVLGVSER